FTNRTRVPKSLRGLEELLQAPDVSPRAGRLAGAVVDGSAGSVEDRDGRDVSLEEAGDERLLLLRRMVDVHDQEARVVAVLGIERDEALRLAIGVPAVRGAEEDHRRTVRGNRAVLQVLPADWKVRRGVVGEGEVGREREALRPRTFGRRSGRENQ